MFKCSNGLSVHGCAGGAWLVWIKPHTHFEKGIVQVTGNFVVCITDKVVVLQQFYCTNVELPLENFPTFTHDLGKCS